MSSRVKVQVKDNSGKIVDDFDMYNLVLAYSEELDIQPDNITDIEVAFIDIPSYLYPELGVASNTHPAGGSFGVNVSVKNQYAGQVQVIPYFDLNPSKSHFDGKPHWNQEVRLLLRDGSECLMQRENVRIIQHQIPESSSLTVSLPELNYPKYTINRDDFRERKV